MTEPGELSIKKNHTHSAADEPSAMIMKPALLRLALTLLSFSLGCHATALPDAARSAPLPAGAGVRAGNGRVVTLDYSKSAPAGYFASTTGSATGAGTIGDPWTLAVAFAGGYPANRVQPGDTVWIRGGTYTGQYLCQLSGTAGNPITFRGYPGERVTIDGNYDPDVPGNTNATIRIMGVGGYVCIQDLEVMNSQTNRWSNTAQTDARGDSIMVWPGNCKIINCVLHDDGEGLFNVKTAQGTEIYGNLIYHDGYYSYESEKNPAIAIDLIPAGGSAITLSGTASGADVPVAASVTFSHNHSGDFLVVAAGARPVENYTNLSVTYDGVSMTRCAGAYNAADGVGPVALFYLATANTGVHNVVVSWAGTAGRIMGVAQSFVNVHQTTPPTASGGWQSSQFSVPPYRVRVSSATNHMVVDAINIYGVYAPGLDYRVNPPDDNTLIRWSGAPSGLNEVGMSYAPGAASVLMGWTWTPRTYGHGHGMYVQVGKECDDAVATATGKTVTSASNPWVAGDVGKVCVVEGGGTAGANLVTTIDSLNSPGSIELHDAVVTSVNPAAVKWAAGITIKDNIIYDGVGANAISAQGTSGGIGVLGSSIVGNLAVGRPYYLGGAGSRFIFAGTTFDNNYAWDGSLAVGYNTADFSGLTIINNYIASSIGMPAAGRRHSLVVGGAGDENTFIGTINFSQSDFSANTYYVGSTPTTNLVVVRPNDYEANRANIYIYNWENLDTVAVDLSSAVAVGTPICIMNAQDYYNTPVYTGVYAGGTVSLPMDGLTAAAGIGYKPAGPTGRAFNAFIVRAQEHERRGRPLMPGDFPEPAPLTPAKQ